MKKNKKFQEPEIVETTFKIVYSEGCASVTQDLYSYYADNIISDAELEYEDCKWHIMKFPKKKSNIKVKKFKDIKPIIEE